MTKKAENIKDGGVRVGGTLGKVLIIISLILLVNPNLNTIDILPDCIAYFILASMVKRYAPLAPYFEEVRDGLRRLGLITLIKLPMMLVMLANMSSGSDIVTLMTLVFVALELITLYPLIGNLFSALFYLGERISSTATLKPFRVLGIRVSPEAVRTLAYVFVTVKGILNLVPEFCLLSSTEDTTIVAMRRLYPQLELSCIGIVLFVGIITLCVGIAYVNSVARGGSLYEAARELAGDERLKKLEYERGVERRLFGLAILFVGALLLFDIRISLDGSTTTDLVSLDVNLLPRCLYAILIMIATPRLTEKRGLRRAIYIFGSIYSVVTVATTVFTVLFNSKYSYTDLINETVARIAYLRITLCEVAELCLMAAMMICFTVMLVRFSREHTGIQTTCESVSRVDIEFKREIRTRSLIFGIAPIVIAALKTVNCLLIGNPQYIYTDPTDITMPVIVVARLPWFGLLIFGITVAYAFYSFYFIAELRNEVKLKYSDEESRFE